MDRSRKNHDTKWNEGGQELKTGTKSAKNQNRDRPRGYEERSGPITTLHTTCNILWPYQAETVGMIRQSVCSLKYV